MTNDDKKHKKDGVSVEEMQSFFHHYGPEICLSLVFVLAAISAIFVFNLENWCVMLLGLGGVVGTLLPKPIRQSIGTVMRYSATTGGKYGPLMISLAAIIISIIASPLVFLIIGLAAGEMIVTAKRGQ
ncbi:MAG: hypothetical protein ACOYK9_02110 [Chlamydiia bacterium]